MPPGWIVTIAAAIVVERNWEGEDAPCELRLVGPRHAVEGYDYVLIARAGTVQRRFTELVKDLERALAKVHEPSPAKKR